MIGYLIILSISKPRKSGPISNFLLGNIPCSMCKMISREIITLKSEDLTQTEIQETLIERCETLPTNSKSVCGIIVRDWFTKLYNSNSESKETCSFVCDGIEKIPIYKPLHDSKKIINPRKLKKPESLRMFDCNTCEMISAFVLEQAPGKIDENASNGFRKHCEELELFKDRCGIFTDESISRSIEYISQNMHPFEICTFYGMC